MNDTEAFDPASHLTKVGGREYLEVKWRLVWLRQRHPDAKIVTELVHLDQGQIPGTQNMSPRAIFKAGVAIPDHGSATGWGSETAKDFGDYIEKAETKAIGRALAALGFGTQFTGDEFGGEARADRPVDAPTQIKQAVIPARKEPAEKQPQHVQSNGGLNDATVPQINAIKNMLERMGRNWNEFNMEGLSKSEASDWIKDLGEGKLPGQSVDNRSNL